MIVIIFLSVPILLALLSALALVVRTRLRARADHRRIRAELEARAAKGKDGVVLLRGRLVVEGAPCAAEPGDGAAKVAARTHWASFRRLWRSEALPSTNERAETLWLETEKGRARIEGPVAVELGSVVAMSGKPTVVDHHKRFDVTSRVVDGDEVWILGARREEAEDGSAKGKYRESATRGVLEPIPENGYSRIVAVSPSAPSVGRRAVLWNVPTIVVVLLGVIPAWMFAADYDYLASKRTEHCRYDGRCHLDSAIRWEGLRALKGLLHGHPFALTAHSQEECLQSSQCIEEGHCSWVDGLCWAAQDEDCAHSLGCRDGNCSAVHNVCVVAKDADCQKGSMCRAYGMCSAKDGGCVVATDADCAQTPSCRESGTCSAREGRCIAARDEDCAHASVCEESGECTAGEERCKKSDERCRSEPNCNATGRCKADGIGLCEVGSEDDCRQSQYCASIRSCALKAGDCEFDDSKTCAESDACRVHGRCGGNQFCTPRSDADCAASSRCKTKGACKRFGDECAASCETSEACRSHGACTPGKGGCVVASDVDCQKSDVCKFEARCSLVDGHCTTTDADCKKTDLCRHGGRCSATDGMSCGPRKPSDCKEAEVCRTQGACTITEGRCGLTSDEDCAATSACETDGKCTFVPATYGGSCELGKNDCKRLPVCKELGACSMVREHGSPVCRASTDAECQQSTVCERFGWCKAKERHCVAPEPAH